MTLFPRSLLARTALVILLALIAAQVVSLFLFSRYFAQPRQQIAVAGFMSHLKSISAALETIPPDKHLEFIGRLQEREGIRIARVRHDNRETEREVVLAPDIPALQHARNRLKREFGDETDVYIRPRNPDLFLIKLPVGEFSYWVVFPRNRLDRDTGWAWLGWAVFGTLISLGGAYLLVRLINRPLRELARAARAIGHGQTPPPLREGGPAEIRAVASAFTQMQEDLGRQERERATFLAGVSHDLRTPLARLRLNVEMLDDKVDEMTREGMVQDIGDMDGIVGQFLDFARAEANEAVAPTDLNALMREAGERASRSGANVFYELGDIASYNLRPVAMRRLLANLVDNAVKHGSTEVLLQSMKERDHVVLAVLDRGPGIPPAEVERLKQPFTRLDASRSGQSGAGLGLAIVDRIARLHSGKLELRARQGGGLDARVVLPA
jgi:two-component system osmolarity sensor histidine kinase EnvZ